MLTLIKNARIHTMDDRRPVAEAALIEDDRFVFVGSLEGAQVELCRRGQQAQEVDAKDRLMLPGLNDSHMHFIHFAKGLMSVNLTGTHSIKEIQERMAEGVRLRPAGPDAFVEGEGWNQDYFTEGERRFPLRVDLDEVSSTVPMMIMRACFHIGVLNSAALKVLNITRETAPSYGDLVEVDENGEPNGIIKESLLDDTKAQISSLNLETLKKIILSAQQEALSQGITSLQSDDVGYTPKADYHLLFRAFAQLEAQGALHIRVSEQCLLQKEELIQEFFDAGYDDQWGSAWFRPSCIKLLADGSLGARTAAMRQPYADDPSTKGLEMFTQPQLNGLVLCAHRHNMPVAIHAIGDRAVEMALDAIENAQLLCPENHPRHGIVHCQITDQALLRRFRTLDVLAFVQPIFIDYDMNICQSRIGEALTSTSYAWRNLYENGVHVSFGTDCPVEKFDTMPNLYSAVTRQNVSGEGKRAFLPQEAMTMEQALKCYTIEGAYASGEEHLKGSITPGKLADFILLDQDLFQIDPEEILHTHVEEAWVSGICRYKKN